MTKPKAEVNNECPAIATGLCQSINRRFAIPQSTHMFLVALKKAVARCIGSLPLCQSACRVYEMIPRLFFHPFFKSSIPTACAHWSFHSWGSSTGGRVIASTTWTLWLRRPLRSSLRRTAPAARRRGERRWVRRPAAALGLGPTSAECRI